MLEKINVVYTSSGSMLRSEVCGAVVVKSFINGNPEIKIGLNKDLQIGKPANRGYSTPSAMLDAISFGENTKTQEFETSRTLSMIAQDGECVLLNYRSTNHYNLPIRCSVAVAKESDYKIEVAVKVFCDIPKTNAATNVLVKIPLPKTTTNASIDFGENSSTTYEFKPQERYLIWGIKKLTGQTEQSMRVRASLSAVMKDPKRHVGPITLKFEVPMHNVTGLQIAFMKIEESKTSGNPTSWIRYITQAGSYSIRIA